MINKINFNHKAWLTTEKIYFLLVVLASLWPILSTPVFAMLDAPAHLYNTRLLYEMIFKHNEAVSQFYVFNSLIVPNWTGHILMLFLMLFFNAIWTQKMFIIIYLIAFPYAFRYLIKVSKGNQALSYFAFPLAYSFFFFLGFFNFLIGLPIMLFSMAYWIKKSEINYTKKYFFLGLFSLLIYFSHPILFAIWCVFIALTLLYEIVDNIIAKSSLKYLVKNIFYSTIAVLPSLILTVNYLLNQPKDALTIKLKGAELFMWLKNMRSLMVFSFDSEMIYTTVLFYCLVGIFICGICYALYKYIKIHKTLSLHDFKSLFWFDMSLVILILYFLLPDESNGGGYISSRLNLLFFIFLTLGLSKLKQLKLINVIFVMAVLFVFNKQLVYFSKAMKPLNKNAETFIKLSDFMEEGKTMISVDESQNWMQGHSCNYVGANKLILTQQNYEASKKYFPLLWNLKARPELYFGEMKAGNTCVWLMPVENDRKQESDYVLVYGYSPLSSECDSLINASINNYYKSIFVSEDGYIRLFGKN